MPNYSIPQGIPTNTPFTKPPNFKPSNQGNFQPDVSLHNLQNQGIPTNFSYQDQKADYSQLNQPPQRHQSFQQPNQNPQNYYK